jgi:hypothetical protein
MSLFPQNRLNSITYNFMKKIKEIRILATCVFKYPNTQSNTLSNKKQNIECPPSNISRGKKKVLAWKEGVGRRNKHLKKEKNHNFLKIWRK